MMQMYFEGMPNEKVPLSISKIHRVRSSLLFTSLSSRPLDLFYSVQLVLLADGESSDQTAQTMHANIGICFLHLPQRHILFSEIR